MITPYALFLTQWLIGVGALASLCLAMNRHAWELSKLDGKSRLSSPLLRVLGWGKISLSFIVSVALQGWSFGLVSALGSLTLSAVIVTMTVTYYLPWLTKIGVVSATLGLLVLSGVLIVL